MSSASEASTEDVRLAAGARRLVRLATPAEWWRRHAVALLLLAVTVVLGLLGHPSPASAPQAALHLAAAAALYALALRWGVARWLAATATVPVLAAALTGRGDPAPTAVLAVALLALGWRAWGPRSLAAGLGAALTLVAGLAVGLLAPTGDVAAAPLLLGLGLGGALLGLAAAGGLGRAAGSGLRGAVLLLTVVPLGGLVGAALGAADAGSWWAAALPVLLLLPTAGALAVTALLRGRRSPAAGRPQADDVDHAALARFHVRYGRPVLAPVTVVIAAYDEAAGLPRVLSTMPREVCGLPVDVVVVDDGSTDGTAEAVEEHGRAYAVASPRNRGQGAALRLGYRVAREHGARYVITTDADAQYDTADMPAVLAPVLDGTADFVTGSRRLGQQHTRDRFRRLGVHVFAWAVRVLAGLRSTDTSFGLRAMRADVTARVTLNQPQYQSSELLLGVRSHGYRVAEVPGTMHVRAAGSTKKGRNLVYGQRYARVVLGTWWREGCPQPAPEVAPALARRPAADPS